MTQLNSHILIIDDEESVLQNISLTLCPETKSNASMKEAASLLFGEEEEVQAAGPSIQFRLEKALNGPAALKLVKASLENNDPFAVVFCDMRMPGWDGLKTIEEIRAIDPRIEVVFLTAFSDHSIDDIARAVGVNISYMSKPFSRPDLQQMATRCMVDWNKARELEIFVSTVSKLRGSENDIEQVLNYIIAQLCGLLETESASIAERTESGFVFRAGLGKLAQQEVFDELQEKLSSSLSGEPVMVNDLRIVPIQSFGLALTVASETQLSPEKNYLIKVFLEHAALALQNCSLHSKLLEKEKMAEIGRTMGFVSHDLRGPIGQAEMLLGLMTKPELSPWPTETLLEKINRCLQQAKELADDILLFAKSDMQITPEETTISELFEHDRDYWQHLAQINKVELEICPGEGTHPSLDGSRLMRAITNIVKNAVEACATKAIRRVRVSSCLDAGNFVCQISDSAEGIPADVLGKLFQPFASAGKTHGTGFGLAIADQVVRLHKGTINVDTGEEGTTFTVTIPAPEQK